MPPFGDQEHADQSYTDNNSNRTYPNWLQRIQEQSWEPELFISGIVIFALFQFPAVLDQVERYLALYTISIFSRGTIETTMISILKVSVYLLITGFSIHIFLRSIWVSFIGLSYAYKDGINSKNLGFRSSFQKFVDHQRTYRSSILRLERYCSTIFAVSFLGFLFIIGLIFFFSLTSAGVYTYMELFSRPDNFGLFNLVMSALILTYFFDFFTAGSLRRWPYINRIYYPIYRLMRWTTLSPLYERIYLGLISNHQRWKVVGFMTFFGLSVFAGFFAVDSRTNLVNMMEIMPVKDSNALNPKHYEDVNKDDPSNLVQIPSDVIHNQHLRVFVVHSTAFEQDQIIKYSDYREKAQKSNTDVDSLKLAALNNFYGLRVNDSTYTTQGTGYYKEATNQRGLIYYLDISHLPRGLHQLTLQYRFRRGEEDEYVSPFAYVEFYKAVGLVE